MGNWGAFIQSLKNVPNYLYLIVIGITTTTLQMKRKYINSQQHKSTINECDIKLKQ